MAHFRKKPVVIEAMQLTETNVRDVQEWCNGPAGRSVQVQWHFEDDAAGPADRVGWLILMTIHGEEAIARPGDWVIAEPKQGRFYPCKPDIFEQAYEAVEVTG